MRIFIFILCVFLTSSWTIFAADVISLSKPVFESVKPDGLYWNFDDGKLGESEPNPVKDISGNGLEGFLLPGENGKVPVYVEGKFGTGIRLQGSHPTEADPRVSWSERESPGLEGSLLLQSGRSFTAGAWIKWNPSDEDAVFVVFERGITGGENGGLNLSIYRTSGKDSRLRMHFPGAYKDAVSRGVDLGDGEWHHVGVCLEQGDEGFSVTFWLDGWQMDEPSVIEGKIPPTEEGERASIFTVGERNVSYHYSHADVSVDDVFMTSGIYSFEP